MELRSNLQVILNCIPIQLLYLVSRSGDVDIWMVRPLFILAPDHLQEIRKDAALRELHCKPTGWNYALRARPTTRT